MAMVLTVSTAKRNRVFTALQEGLFPIINDYRDLMFTNRTGQNASELRALYVLHVINHLTKSRDIIMKNSAKINAASEEKRALMYVGQR